MYGCESWTIKKAERRRIDAFELWCWRRLLRVPWTARKSNQSILKETSPGCSLEGLILKLKLQYFDHLMRRADSFENILMLGKTEGRGRRGQQRMGDNRGWDGRMASLTQWTWVWVDSGNWWWTGRPGMLWFMRSQGVRHDWATELNWLYGKKVCLLIPKHLPIRGTSLLFESPWDSSSSVPILAPTTLPRWYWPRSCLWPGALVPEVCQGSLRCSALQGLPLARILPAPLASLRQLWAHLPWDGTMFWSCSGPGHPTTLTLGPVLPRDCRRLNPFQLQPAYQSCQTQII